MLSRDTSVNVHTHTALHLRVNGLGTILVPPRPGNLTSIEEIIPVRAIARHSTLCLSFLARTLSLSFCYFAEKSKKLLGGSFRWIDSNVGGIHWFVVTRVRWQIDRSRRYLLNFLGKKLENHKTKYKNEIKYCVWINSLARSQYINKM